MLSYQHIYHAGNHVDCHKHCILSALLIHLGRFQYIDTHSGRGLYDLGAPEAAKIQEYRTGIDKIWPLGNWPREIRRFQHLLEELNPDGVCRYYPGSPLVAYAHAGTESVLDLYEIHPQELAALQKNMRHKSHVTIHPTNGWDALRFHDGLPPQPDARRVILIDPSYELKDEYETIGNDIAKALSHYPDAIILLWFPLLQAKRHEVMIDLIRQHVPHSFLRSEIHIAPPEEAKGLYATGILAFNLPDEFEKTVDKITSWLTRSIGTHSLCHFEHPL